MARIRLTRTVKLTLFFLRVYFIAILILLVVKFIKIL